MNDYELSPKEIAGNTRIRPTQASVSHSQVLELAKIVSSNDADQFWSEIDYPITIEHRPNGDFLTDGHHRFLACKFAGIEPPAEAVLEEFYTYEWLVPYEWENVEWIY